MELKMQRKVASRILKCGMSRVWFDPSRVVDVEEAITAADIRRLIGSGIIKALPKRGISNLRRMKKVQQKKKGRQKGHGSRKGSKGARTYRKGNWMNKVRSQRKLLKELRDSGRIEKSVFRDVYYKSKSGFFRSRAHMLTYL
ncbi:MAG: 50S ribosomal protein L19e [Candidatus Aenigmarchaeota archaeon]|nr:50S ribosomal protein L19e [Candidatus Aenigmarchaeota archaeon]